MPPDKQWWGYLFLLSTGGGAIIWLYVYLHDAHGPKRRGLAFGLAVIDLLAELALVYADTMTTSSENGMIQGITPEFMRTFILFSILAIGINILGFFFYKLWDPEKEQERRAQDIGDDIEAEAMKMLASPEVKKQMIDRHSPEIQAAVMARVAETIAQRFTTQLKNTPTYQQPAALPPPNPDYQVATYFCPTCQIQTMPNPHTGNCGRCGRSYIPEVAGQQPPYPVAQPGPGMVMNEQTVVQPNPDFVAHQHRPGEIYGPYTEPSYHPVSMDPKPKEEPPAADAPFQEQPKG